LRNVNPILKPIPGKINHKGSWCVHDPHVYCEEDVSCDRCSVAKQQTERERLYLVNYGDNYAALDQAADNGE